MTIKKDHEDKKIENSAGVPTQGTLPPIYDDIKIPNNKIDLQRNLELHLCRERCMAALNNIEEAYFENDLSGIVTFVNDAACRMMGKSFKEAIGMNFRDYSHPDAYVIMEDIYTNIFKTGQVVIKDDYNLLMPDGTYKMHELIAGLIKDPAGTPLGFYSIVKDVTELHKFQKVIRSNEERYKNILDSMEESYFEVDLKGKLKFFNNTVLRDLGYSSEEMELMSFRQLTDEENSKKLFESFHSVFLTGESIKGFEWTILKKNGETIPVEGSVSLTRDSEGNPTGFRGVVRDISERKKSDEAIKDSTDKYRSILETMDESYFEEDLGGNFTFFNDSFVRDLGYTRDEIMGMSYRESLSPENIKKAQKIWGEIYSTGKPQHIENYEIIRKDGTVVVLDLYSSLLRDKKGEPVGFWGIGRDITEKLKSERALMESERRYRLIAENVHDVIWTMDLNNTLTYLSPSVYRVFGYKPEELVNIRLVDRLQGESKEKILRIIEYTKNMISNQGSFDPHISRTYEIEMKRKDGTLIVTEVTSSFIVSESGKITGILGITRDITERKKADEEKSRLESQLIQAQKMESVGRLAGGVAHDFNNMLSVIMGYVEMIKLNMSRIDPLYDDILEIEKAAMRSRDLTSQLLAFSRKQVISPKIINLNNQIDSIGKTLSRLIGEDLELKFNKADDLWTVKFDPSQIEQILINLSVNARDAMKNGGKLTIETMNVTIDDAYCRDNIGFVPGQFVELIISDNGTGIDKKSLPYIFEPFYTTKDIGQGTGLGLAMVYGIVKQNGGFINVYSEPDFGTTFRLYFPRCMDGVEIVEIESDNHVLPDSGFILLVEDDTMVRKMVTDMLEAIGYSVVASDNPLDAIRFCEQDCNSIDLVITDVIMPSMSGRDLREHLLNIIPDIKVLFMSGYTADVIVHHGVLEKGMYFLQKPFSMKDLSVKVREALSGY